MTGKSNDQTGLTDQRWAIGLRDVLGVRPQPIALFLEAFTHSSYANEQPDPKPAYNQRLEFLGDAVIDLSIANELWRRFPSWPEGDLARARAALVNTSTLADVARNLHLSRWLRIGKGEAQAGGQDRDSTLCDLFEAVVGAMFIGCGWETADEFVLRCLHDEIEAVGSATSPGIDGKTRLQELLHRRGPASPQYVVTATEGPPHARRFTVAVRWNEQQIGTGQGSSKRSAEQAAAADALKKLV